MSKNTGELNLILGCMWSSKTTSMLTRYERHTIKGRKCLLVRYKKDDRYDNTKVVTHNKRFQIESILATYLFEIDHMVKKYDVVCVDEVQFFSDAHIFCQKWANAGIIVEACGLNGKFDLSGWPVINKLIPLVDDIKLNKAVCKKTGRDAIYTKALDPKTIKQKQKDGIAIGGDDMYSAVDRKTYYSDGNMVEKCKRYMEFVDIYTKYKGVKIYDVSKVISHFNKCYKDGMSYVDVYNSQLLHRLTFKMEQKIHKNISDIIAPQLFLFFRC